MLVRICTFNGSCYFVRLTFVFSANLFAFAAGTAVGWPSPMIPKLKDDLTNPLPSTLAPEQESWVAGCFNLGMATANLFCGVLADRIGRKRTLQYLAVPATLSFVILSFADEVVYFYIGRLIQGIGFGSAFSVLPLYVAEIARDSNRGTLGCFLSMFVVAGALFSYILGPYMSIRDFSLMLVNIPCIFLIIFSLFIPESPYYLVANGDYTNAELCLIKFRGTTRDNVQKELKMITQEVQLSIQSKVSVRDLYTSKPLKKGLIVCLGLMVLQQLSGITVVLSYMQSIFDAAGTSIPPEISTILVGTVQLLVVVITTAVIDKLGKRVLLISSALSSFIAQTSLGVYFYLQNAGYNVDVVSWLPIASLILYIVGFNFGLAVVPWGFIGEMFPPNAKAVASTMACVTCTGLSFVTSVFFPYLNVMIGIAGSFWLFGGCCAIGFAFIYFTVPETKGKGFSEILDMLADGRRK